MAFVGNPLMQMEFTRHDVHAARSDTLCTFLLTNHRTPPSRPNENERYENDFRFFAHFTCSNCRCLRRLLRLLLFGIWALKINRPTDWATLLPYIFETEWLKRWKSWINGMHTIRARNCNCLPASQCTVYCTRTTKLRTTYGFGVALKMAKMVVSYINSGTSRAVNVSLLCRRWSMGALHEQETWIADEQTREQALQVNSVQFGFSVARSRRTRNRMFEMPRRSISKTSCERITAAMRLFLSSASSLAAGINLVGPGLLLRIERTTHGHTMY